MLTSKTDDGRAEDLYFAYARSFWLRQSPLPDSVKTAMNNMFQKMLLENAAIASLGRSAMLITTTLRLYPDESNSLHIKALEYLRSIEQMAINSEHHWNTTKGTAAAISLLLACKYNPDVSAYVVGRRIIITR